MHQPVEPLGIGQVVRNVGEHRLVQPFEHGHPAPETLREIDLAAHRAFGDRAYLLSDPGALGQFVDHFGFDQRRIHIETDQPARPAEHIIGLKRNIHPHFGRKPHEFGLHPLAVARRTAHRQFDARFWSARIDIQRDTPREPQDRVDVQSLPGHHVRDRRDLLRAQLTAEHRDDVTVFPLHSHPVFVLFGGNRLETHLNAQFVGLEQQVLHDVAGPLGIGLEQDAHRQGLVDIGLPDIQDRRIVARQNIGQRRSQPRLVLPGNINLYDFYLFVPVFHRFVKLLTLL